MSAPLLTVHGLVKRYGGLTVTNEVDLEVRSGEIHALIGPNGAGKTTMLAQLTGEVRPDAGRIEFDGRDITALAPHRRARLGMGRSFQITSIFHALSVLDNVRLAVQVHAGHSFCFWKKAAGQPNLDQPSLQLLQQVGLIAEAGRLASHLSHGQHRQLEIAIALAGEPRLLLLDEPMAGMGIEDGQRLTQMLLGLKGKVTMLLVEHDMSAVFALADRISVLVYGKCVATGTPDDIRNNAEVREAYLGQGRMA